MARSAEEPAWTQPPCRRIGKALLETPNRTLTAPEITARGGGSNVARTATKLCAAGMLMQSEPSPKTGHGPGRRAERAFYLPDDQVEPLRAALAATTPVAGQLATGQQLVFVGSEKVSALMEALDVSELPGRGAWFALCDGRPQEYVIAFSGEDAVENAETLVSELQGAGLAARRASVARVAASDALVVHAHKGASASRKSRMRNTA